MSFEGDVTTLTFSPDNPCNTTITSETGDVLFSVVTEHTKKATYTQVRDTDDEVIGSLEWREVLPDRVTIGHRKPVSYADWMKKSLLPFKDEAAFIDDQGRKYKWKGIGPGRTIELYTLDDGFAAPIARYHRSRRILTSQLGSLSASDPEKPSMTPMASTYSLTPTLTDTRSITSTLADSRSIRSVDTLGRRSDVTRTPGRLDLLPRGQEVMDLVVLSVLFLEKQNKLHGGGVADNTLLGMNRGVMFATTC